MNPATSVDELVEGLRQTINSEAEDSPVFQMLPDLDEQDRHEFLPIPREYREEVERATQKKELGDLELLAAEARGFEWEIEGLRLVGRAQFNLKAFEGARADVGGGAQAGSIGRRGQYVARHDLSTSRRSDQFRSGFKARARSQWARQRGPCGGGFVVGSQREDSLDRRVETGGGVAGAAAACAGVALPR